MKKTLDITTLDRWLKPLNKIKQKTNENTRTRSDRNRHSQKSVFMGHLNDKIDYVRFKVRYRKSKSRRVRKIRREPLDEWDGSIDNQEKVLEDHVSKYGWEF